MAGENSFSQIADNFLFPHIFRTFRLAVQPSKMIIAFLALAVICLAGWIMDFSKSVVATVGGNGQVLITELDVYVNNNGNEFEAYIHDSRVEQKRVGVFETMWDFSFKRFHGVLAGLFSLNLSALTGESVAWLKGVCWALRYHTIYSLIFTLIKFAVLAVAGGAICRISALQFAHDEKPGLFESLRYSSSRFVSFFAAPLIPAGLVLLTSVAVFLLGLVANIPWAGEVIVAVMLPMVMMAGAVMTIFLIAILAGFNLMYPTIAFEESDCFDAFSRSFNYVFSRPWRLFVYTVLAAIYGGICYIFVRMFVFAAIFMGRQALSMGIFTEASSGELSKIRAFWPQPDFMNLAGNAILQPGNWSELFASVLTQMFLHVASGLVVAFLISFYFSANSIIYALLRKMVDEVSLDQVSSHAEMDKTS